MRPHNLLSRFSGVEKLQENGSDDGGDHNEKDHRRKILGFDHSHRKSLLRNDQRHLASGHHANADFQRIDIVEMKDPGHKTAPDDFGDKRDSYKQDAEQKERRGHLINGGFQSDTAEEHRSKQHVGADVHLSCNILGILDAAQNDAGHIGSGNIRNAEVFFCDVGHGEGQDKAENRETACVGIFAVEEFEKPVNKDPENSCACEKQQGTYDNP